MKQVLFSLLIIIIMAGNTYGANIKNGDLVISEAATGGGIIYSLDPYTGVLNTIASGGPIHHPEGMAIAPDGSIIVTDWWAWTNPAEATSGARSIYSIDPVTDTIDIILSGGPLVTPIGVVLSDDDNLLVIDHGTNSAQGQVLKIDRVSGSVISTNTHSSMYSPQGIVKDERNGNIFISDHNGYIFSLDQDTLDLTNLGRIPHTTQAWSYPQDMIVTEDGNLLVATLRGKIFEMNTVTGVSQLLFDDNIYGDIVPDNSAFDSLAWIDYNTFAVVNHGSAGDVFAFDYDMLSKTITGVSAVYDDGQVNGGSLYIPLGVERYTVVPEPAASLLFITGLITFLLYAGVSRKNNGAASEKTD